MTGSELKEAAEEIFGPTWRTALASWLQIDRTQIWRYVKTGHVPGPVAAAVEERLARHRQS